MLISTQLLLIFVDFMDRTEKNDANAQPTLVTPDRIEDKKNYLAPAEIMCRISKSPYYKMKSRINLRGLSTEEIDDFTGHISVTAHEQYLMKR